MQPSKDLRLCLRLKGVPAELRSGLALDENRGAVAENFGDAGHHFGGVVANADHTVGAKSGGVFGHLVIGVEPGAFAEIGVDRDVAAENGLQLRAKLADNGTRAHNDSAHKSEGAGNFVSWQIEGRGDEAVVHTLIPWKLPEKSAQVEKIFSGGNPPENTNPRDGGV